MNTPAEAAVKLHRYLVGRHWSDQGLIGPDPGIRWNYRIGRFLKSYLGGRLWNDDLYYLQAQGYWTLGNWSLFARGGDTACRQIATGCCETMLARQRPTAPGYIPTPNGEAGLRPPRARGARWACSKATVARATGDFWRGPCAGTSS